MLLFGHMHWNFALFEDYLPIKTVAEYAYCPRAAIYMYLNWENDLRNVFLYEGEMYHKRFQKLLVKHRVTGKQLRNFLVVSRKLKIYGICDSIEEKGDELIPIEYKSGYPEVENYHKIQLALQAFCLSEMFNKEVNFGIIYFRKIHRRKIIDLTSSKDAALKLLEEFRKKIASGNIDLRDFPSCGKRGCSYFSVDNLPQCTQH